MNIHFTPAQLKHAQKVALQLYKQRRFFLPNEVSGENPLPYLPVNEFAEIYRLNGQFSDFYSHLARNAELAIIAEEMKHGIARHKPTNGQALVECKRYSGGLDIVAALPLRSLLLKFPSSQRALEEQLREIIFPAEKVQESQLLKFEASVHKDSITKYTDAVFADYQKMQREIHWQNNVLVVLETRFVPDGFRRDIMLGKLNGLITYPHLASYIIFKALLSGTTFTSKPYTIFTSSRLDPLCVMHQKGLPPCLFLVECSNYGQTVALATIL